MTKSEIKYYSSLLQKKYRSKEKKFLAEGKRLVEEGLRSGSECEIIFITKEFKNRFPEFVRPLNIHSEVITNSEFNKISDTKNPQGVAAVFKMTKHPRFDLSSSLIIGLEDISDPGNIGTILRSCDWFGVKDIIVDDKCADVYNPKTIRSSMGAVFHLNIFVTRNIYEELRLLKKENAFAIITADMNGENLYKFDFPRNSAVIFCNETNGPSEKLLELSNHKVTIPKFGKVESLNVANAASIILSNYKLKK